MFSSIAFSFFKASDIIEISEIGDLNNFPKLCGGDQVKFLMCMLLFLTFQYVYQWLISKLDL